MKQQGVWRKNKTGIRNKFKYAFNGVIVAFRTQSSFRIHIMSAVFAYALGLALGISIISWIFINTSILLVIIAELFNTAVERICDFVHKEHNKLIMIIKDISAAAVLITVLNATITGLIIFVPAIVKLF